MRKALIIIMTLYVLSGAVSAVGFYTWSGSLEVGQSVYVNDLILTVDRDNKTGALALIIDGGARGLLLDGQKGVFAGLEISFISMDDYGVVSISSDRPFTVSFTKEDYTERLKQLEEENAALKAQNANLTQKIRSLEAQVQKLQEENEKLKKQASSTADVKQLYEEITKLTKENRELKAELANLTTKYNQLKAKADFLSQQNEEYRQIIQQVMNEQSSEAKQSYIEKAKKEKLVGSVLLKGLTASLVVVGLVGYGLYRKKRSWEFGGL